jgi:Regulator of chromosome condensation (RCC1) repeat/Immunoglobulin domain/Immunoglobulin I-set domain
MKSRLIGSACFLTLFALAGLSVSAQVTVPLPGRSLAKLAPDYLRPRVYALNKANGSVPGTLLALNSTNGAIISEISVNLNPTDMAITPAGDSLYVINAGSRTISKVDLATFTVGAEKAISTPNTYSTANPLYVVAGQSGKLFYTDGAWGPEIYFFDFDAGTNVLVLNTGGNQDFGAGGMILNRSGTNLYVWKQYGWGAGNVNSWVTRYAASSTGTITPLEDSFTSWRRDPLDTPLFLDAAERWVFNKQQMFAATNVSVLINQFSDNIYGISLDGSVAFGPTEVFNTRNGNTITNLSFSTTVQSLSGDQAKLFRYNASSTSVVIYDMATIAAVSGPTLVPTPANGAVVSLPLTNLSWTVSPTALAYDVYFGTNQAQVAAATPGGPQYLGRVTTPPQPLNQTLLPGTNYYWRVDTVGFNATNTGTVWSFTASTLSINPAAISCSAIAGYNPSSLTLSLTSAVPVAWTGAVTGPGWLGLSPTAGNSPTNAVVTFSTAGLAAGQYTNNLEFTAGALKLEVPVLLTVRPLNITKMVADRQRPYLYAIQPPPLSGQSGLLLFINATNGNIDKTLSIGINPVDLSINYPEGRLYIASWTETWTYVVDLNMQSLLPSLNLGTDVYKINAGRAGRVITEGEDQWVGFGIADTVGGTNVYFSGYAFREGDGEFDLARSTYYHCDNNISDAHIHKYLLTNDTPVEVAGSAQHPYGTRNLVLSADGTRLFWNSYMYDTNLTELGGLGAEIYSCSTNGGVAFGSSTAFDTVTRQAIFSLPAASSVSAVDGQNQRFWYFNTASATLGSVPMATIQSPSITQQPAANTSVSVNGSVYLTVTAMGLAPLSYQWTMFGTNIPGATNYFLSMPSVQPAQQGDYNAVVTNPFGSVTSTVAHVTVLVPPSITSQSGSTNVLAGQSFSLTVTPAGTAPFTYRWMFENANISGGTSQTLTINNAQSANEGIYRVAVGNAAGSVTSAPVSVRVFPAAPLITSNPVSLSVAASSNASFGVSAIGSQPLGYQWLFQGAPLAGAAASQLSLLGVQSSNSGAYKVVVSNSMGSVTSAVASLIVTPLAPYFTIQPVGAALSAGSTRTLTGLANGSQPIAYQWQRNSTNLPGATSTSLALTNLAASDSGPYAIVASNSAGASTSAVAQITIYQTPTVVQGLSNIVVDINSTLTLSANVLGSPTLVYSWQLNGQSIAGSNSTLNLTNIQPSQSGYYRLTVTNQYGSISSTGRVSVLGWPSAVAAWGDNSGGQTNVPAGLNDIIAVAGGDYHSVALHHDGTLLGWGYNGDNQTGVPTNALRFVSLASGAAHGLAITEKGSVVAWGRNEAGQCNVPAGATNNILSVAAGDAHSLALLSSGSVLAWGDNSLGQCSVPQGLSGVRAIAAGRNHSLALRTNGTVVGWGFNSYGQASAPVLSNAVAIAAGYLHSLALLSNGTVVAWGDNTFGQCNVPSGLTNIVALAAGDFHTLALRANGTVSGWGDDSYGQIDAPVALTNVFALAGGNYHGLALVPSMGVLQPSLISSQFVVRWTGLGTLQWAPTPQGPYSDVGCQGTCYTNVDMSAPARFFRLRR